MKLKQHTLDSSIDSDSLELTTNDSESTYSLDSIDKTSQQYNYSEEEQELILKEDSAHTNATSYLQGLGTNFYSSKIKITPKGSVEYFLNDLAKELLKRAFSQKKGDEEIHPKFPLHKDISKFISELIKDLKNLNYIIVPTDKTNGCIMIKLEEYAIKMKEALAKVFNLISAKMLKDSKQKQLIFQSNSDSK